MTFKLRSQVVISAYCEGIPPVEHLVLRREEILRPGKIIRTKGFVAKDVEAKGPWDTADVVIRIIDEERLGIAWQRERLSKIARIFFPYSDDNGYWETESIILGRNPLELGDTYHSLWGYKMPEVFTLLDRICIPMLVERKSRALEGIKSIVRKTEFIYEPTLPPQSRK